MTTRAEARHMAKVAALPCAVCGEGPVEVHHILQGRTPGRRASNWLTIPLCPSCHRSDHNGIHGRKSIWQVMHVDEYDCLAATLAALYGDR